MRQRKKFSLELFLSKKQEIKIDGPWFFKRFFPASQHVLDPQEPGHHLCGLNVMHLDLSDHIQEIKIAFEAHGLGFINIGKAIHAEISLDKTAHGRQKVPGAVAKVRS